jgi:NDP-sugar pyrophosphorylase family protein
VLGRLRALILLGGGVRSSEFVQAVRRSLLDLPIDPMHSLLDLWQAHAAMEVAYAGLPRLSMRIITNSVVPRPLPDAFRVAVSIEHDPYEMRGTGGLLRDIAEAYADDDFIAVANANQILFEPLAHLLAGLEATGADVSLAAQQQGTSGDVLLARCGSLRVIPRVGFIDLKEQALPMIARHATVKVLHRPGQIAMPVRTCADYLSALRAYHLRSSGDVQPDAFIEDWQPVFRIVEAAAEVHPSARVHDSVVLRGARIERGAIVARCVVCPGAVVRREQVCVDRLLCADV